MDGSFPPSPVEDRVSKRLSVGSLLQKLAELKGTSPMGGHPAGPCRRTQTGVSGSVVDLSESDSSFSFDPLEESLSADVVAAIARSLGAAGGSSSRLVPPDRLLSSIGRELVRLAACEPCGLRGALIDLCVDRRGGPQGDGVCGVDQIAVDASLVPTFHVTLVLRTETAGIWPKVQRLFGASRSPQGDAGRPQTLRLSTGFRAIKRKLYCSGELLVEECC
ncbi:unnamed protein product [Merluccius merluccius]